MNLLTGAPLDQQFNYFINLLNLNQEDKSKSRAEQFLENNNQIGPGLFTASKYDLKYDPKLYEPTEHLLEGPQRKYHLIYASFDEARIRL